MSRERLVAIAHDLSGRWVIENGGLSGTVGVASSHPRPRYMSFLGKNFAMPELSGIEATRLIKEALPRIEVLIFTLYDT